MAARMRKRGAYPGFDGLARMVFKFDETKALAKAILDLGAQVKSALIDVEQAAYDAVEEIGRTTRPAWNIVSVVHGIPKVDAQPWDMVVVSGGYTSNLTILIPAPTKHNRGVEIAVLKRDARPVTVQPISGLVAGAASDSTIAASHGRVYVSTGEEWIYYA